MMGGMHGPGMGPEMHGGMGGMHGPGMRGGMKGDGMPGGMMGMQRMLQQLPDVTDEQRRQIRELSRDLRRQHLTVMADLMDLRDEMHEQMHEVETPDPERVRELHDRMSALRGDLLEARVRARNELHGLLTEEQREWLAERKQQPMERRPDRPMRRPMPERQPAPQG